MSFSENAKINYIALIGDIKMSKSIKNRGEIQIHVTNILKTVNDKYADSIASKFLITLGDEFQGLLLSGEHVMDIIHFISEKLYPVKIRFGIGIGTITTEINPDAAIGADGPAYYMARECIDHMKMAEGTKGRVCGDVQIRIEGSHQIYELTLNTIFNLMHCIEHDWTAKQKKIANYALSNKEKQTDIAKHFNVSQSHIQQVLSTTHFYTCKDAYESVNTILKEVLQHDV